MFLKINLCLQGPWFFSYSEKVPSVKTLRTLTLRYFEQSLVWFPDKTRFPLYKLYFIGFEIISHIFLFFFSPKGKKKFLQKVLLTGSISDRGTRLQGSVNNRRSFFFLRLQNYSVRKVWNPLNGLLVVSLGELLKEVLCVSLSKFSLSTQLFEEELLIIQWTFRELFDRRANRFTPDHFQVLLWRK